jgi:Cytochrome c/Cytochrome c7 and related cytochrome c
MIVRKPLAPKLIPFVLFFIIFSSVKISAQDGKALFQSKCATCHNIFKPTTGPALKELEQRGKWSDHKEILRWATNPAAYMANDPYTQGLKAQFGIMMTSQELTIKDVDAIVSYINQTVANANKPQAPGDTEAPGGGSENAVIFGVISLILAIIALILMQVNSNLKKMSDDAEGIQRPEPVPFYRNKVYIAIIAILLFIVGGYYLSKGAIGLGRQKGYQPVQPIYYSHKVHAGINQINCLYCHGSAWESKTAGVPAVNICMNCHKAITEYSQKSMKLYNEEGDEVNGTAEIAKLYKYAGFDPAKPNSWDPSKAKPIEWIKIHNLPDHVYFNHSQHIRVGNVQCQTCHGEITDMNEVKQVSELSMGWCINCHRQTKVNFNYDSTKGNKFYSIYEKFHNDFKAGKMDSITVKDIGGIECQKCHY